MNILWRNECTFWSSDNISQITPYSWTNFIKKDFWLEAPFRLWWNECFVTKWLKYFDVLLTFPASPVLAEQLLSKKFFDWKYGLGCDEMNFVWPNDCTFWSSDKISLFTPSRWTILVKEGFWLEAWFRLWRNECFVTKWLHILIFW